MIFGAPLWLLGLLAWLPLIFRLFRGRRVAHPVPHLPFWTADQNLPPPARQWMRPPARWLLLAAAGAVALIAAANPIIRRSPGVPHDRSSAPASFPAPRRIEIVHVAAADHPHGQVMLTLRNTASACSAEVLVSGAGVRVEMAVPLAGGETRSIFIDLPVMAPIIDISATGGDDNFAAARARLTRHTAWPRIVETAALPPPIERMLAVYRTQRPPSEDSPIIKVTADAGGAEGSAVLLGVPDETPDPGSPAVIDDPITRALDWRQWLGAAPLTVAPPPRDQQWRTLVSVTDHPLLAVRSTPWPAVWVGFDTPARSADPAFVIFWTNVLDHLANGAGEWSAAILPAEPGPPPQKQLVAGEAKLDEKNPPVEIPLGAPLALIALLLTVAALLPAARRSRPGLQELRG